MEKSTFYFKGVRVSDKSLTGTIDSSELINQFRPTWIPFYQRDRINNKSKIASLVEIYRTGQIIDSIKLNVRGDFDFDQKTGLALVTGDVSIIDGLQRTMALLDSGAHDLKIPVELYMNLTSAEEIALFHQFNRKPTALRFGDMVKSVEGLYADELRRIILDKTYPVPVHSSNVWRKVPIGVIGGLLMLVHRKTVNEVYLIYGPSGSRLIKFLSDPRNKQEDVEAVSRRVKVIMEYLRNTFGEYNGRAVAWKKNMIIALTRIVNDHFINEHGEVDTRNFQDRFDLMPIKLFNDAYFRQVNITGLSNIPNIHRALIQFLNFNKRGETLPEQDNSVTVDEDSI